MLVNLKLRAFVRQKFGVNLHIIYKLLSFIGYNSSLKFLDKVWTLISEADLLNLYTYLLKFFKIESVLQSQIFANIRLFKLLKGYKGFRHYYNLPVHGQRTKTNAKTAKRNKKIVKISSLNLFKQKKIVNKKSSSKTKKNIVKVKNVAKTKKK